MKKSEQNKSFAEKKYQLVGYERIGKTYMMCAVADDIAPLVCFAKHLEDSVIHKRLKKEGKKRPVTWLEIWEDFGKDTAKKVWNNQMEMFVCSLFSSKE